MDALLACIAATSTDPDVQLRGVLADDLIAHELAIGNPHLTGPAAVAAADQLAGRSWQQELVLHAASDDVRAALRAHPDITTASLIRAPWVTDDETVAFLRAADTAERRASLLNATLDRYGPRRASNGEPTPLDALPEAVLEAFCDAAQLHDDDGDGDGAQYRLLAAEMIELTETLRRTGRRWYEPPHPAISMGLALWAGRREVGTAGWFVAQYDALTHPACDTRAAELCAEALWRGWFDEKDTWAAIAAPAVAAHPEHAEALLSVLVRNNRVTVDVVCGLVDAVPAARVHAVKAFGATPAATDGVTEALSALIGDDIDLVAHVRLDRLKLDDCVSDPLHAWGARIMAFLERTCPGRLDAAFTLLEQRFAGTLGELAAVLDGVTTAPTDR